MLKTNKKGFVQLLFNPYIFIILVLIILLVIFGFPKNSFKLSIYDDNIKKEYTTFYGGLEDWRSLTVSDLTPICCNPCASKSSEWTERADQIKLKGNGCVAGADGLYYEDSKFIIEANGAWSINSNENGIGTSVGNNGGIRLQAKQKFKGQEIAVIFGGTREKYNINQIVSTDSDPDIVKIILKPHTLEPTKWDVIKGGEKIREITAEPDGFLRIYSQAISNSGGSLFFLGYKAQYECDLAPDEVFIQESFSQPFSIKDTSFPVTKLCKEVRPFILRDIQQGEQAWYPNPMPSFNRGETLQVPSGQIAVINYATPNVVGVTNPCPPDSANIKIAGKWVCSQIIKTTTITREILKREIIPITDANSFTFNSNKDKKSFLIGLNAFSASQQFGCDFPNDINSIDFPSPNADCYTSTINYEDNSYKLKDKQLLNLNKNIAIQYFVGGGLKRTDEGIEDNLQGTYVFNIVNPLDINLEGGASFKQNEIGGIHIKIMNNLPKNDITLKITQKVVRTNENLMEKTIILKGERGINDYNFDIDTTNLGVNEITIQAFYPITADANILLPSEKIRINVEILGEQPSIIKFVEVEKEKVVTIEKEKIIIINPVKSFFSKIIAWIKNIFG